MIPPPPILTRWAPITLSHSAPPPIFASLTNDRSGGSFAWEYRLHN